MRSRTAGVAIVAVATVLALIGCSPVTDRPAPEPVPSPSAPLATATSPQPRPSVTATSPTVERTPSPMPDITPDGFRSPPPGSGLQRYVDQAVEWTDCGAGTDCAEIAVPLDYDEPDGEAITLALRRHRGGDDVRGSLFLNPGGPGGSGLGMAAGFGPAFAGSYDVIGWDPRGVGQSTPVDCVNGEGLDEFYGLDSSPDTKAERAELLKGVRSYVDSCLAKSGRLLEHISTVETVRDLDLMRQIVGDEELNFLGFSYGTEIGAVYAELFGSTVGRMVLDSAVNITGDESIVQAQGFDRALGHFAQWCASGNCDFGRSSDEVIARITDLWDDLDANPLRVGDRELTQSLAVTGVLQPLYQDEQEWPSLRQALSEAFNGNGAGLLAYADAYNQRGGDGEYGQLLFAFDAIRCLDEADPGVTGARREAREIAEKAPIFGPYLGADLICPLWPVPAREPLGTITGAGAAPILVVGTTGDSATPYEYAEWMAEQLESGVLLTLDGEGHGAFGGANACINNTVFAYLINGTVPQDGMRCS